MITVETTIWWCSYIKEMHILYLKKKKKKKLEQSPQICVKLSYRDLCGSELSSLHPSDMVIIHWVKNRLKTEK